MTQLTDASGLVIIYDGACPFCSDYTKRIQIREHLTTHMTLLDARSGDPRVTKAAADYDLDAGMLVRFAGADYFGADAVHFLSLTTTNSGVFNALIGRIFRHRRLAQTTYPLLKAGRRAVLRAFGVKPI